MSHKSVASARRSASRPVWGRAALGVFVGILLLSYVGVATNTLPGVTWALCLLAGCSAGAMLAVVSLVKRERRGFAVTTLILAGGLPVAVAVGFVIFFQFVYAA